MQQASNPNLKESFITSDSCICEQVFCHCFSLKITFQKIKNEISKFIEQSDTVKMESTGRMTAYLVLRLLFGLVDIASDIGLAVPLFLKGALLWGWLTLLWRGIGLLAALVGVTVGRCRTGDSMSCAKFALLTLKLYVEVVQGFFLSGNQVQRH